MVKKMPDAIQAPEVCRGTFSAPGQHRAVGAGGVRRDRHRPGRGDRRRGGAVPALRTAAADRWAPDGRGRLRAAGAAGARAPAVRAGGRGAVRRDRHRVRDHRAAGPDRDRAAGRRPGAGLRRPPEPAVGHGHPRRDGDAARHLPALGAHLPTRPAGHRRAAPPPAAGPPARGVGGHGVGRAGQRGDARGRGGAVPRFTDPGHRHPRRRVRRPGPRPRRPGGDPVRARAARVGLRVVGRGNLRGPGRDAGLRATADPAVRPPRPDPDPGDRGALARRRPDRRPGVLAGGAGVRHPVRPRPAGPADPRPRADGRTGEPHPHDGGGRGGRGRDHRPERRAPLAHVHLSTRHRDRSPVRAHM